jgi:hypothetical protein
MLPRLAATALLLTTLPASAAFLERHEHWTVTGGSAPSCIAVNRPPAEFNHQPYAALAIHQRRNRGPRLQMFAWPGAFKSGDKVTIEIRIASAHNWRRKRWTATSSRSRIHCRRS